MRRLAWALAVAAGVTGCGSPSADLFEVRRSGEDAAANVTILVSDGGTVTCNGDTQKALDAERLLDARELARDLAEQAALGLELEPQEGSDVRYEVELEPGIMRFADNSAGRTPEMNRLVAFSADVIEQVCGLER